MIDKTVVKPEYLESSWKHEVFDESENQIAKYYSSLTDSGDRIKFSNITLPKMSSIFTEFDNYVEIKKQDLQNITFEELLTFLKDVKPNEKQSKKDCLIEYLESKQIKYNEGLWDETVE